MACPLPKFMDLNYKTQCATRIVNGKTEIVTVTFYAESLSTCTSLFNLENNIWHRISGLVQPKYGGYIFSGLNNAKIYYIGGIDNEILKLDEENIWSLMSNVKLPFPIVSNATSFFWQLRSENCTRAI